MSEMIKTASDFQYSVNILYDLHNSQKVKNFIPTKSSLQLIEEILLSTENNSSRRSRILIGAYGKGKSHIILTILSLLMKHKPQEDFYHLNKKLENNPQLKQLVQNHYEKNGNGLLPVLVSGSNTSLTQAFIIALQHTLSENNLLDIMPETNYKAASQVILKWEKEYPDTYKKFSSLIEETSEEFVEKLNNYDIETYKVFENIYPTLTAGSNFNPFLGFDVVELYESVVKELRRKNLYDGIYVVYDEFSKYLEANITTASVSDTKMLQDFAEKSCRSGENQLHLLLISHKEISNYIDKLPKQKVDGWRGISERFEHILLNNNFTQIYEIISSVIQKDKTLWNLFLSNNEMFFSEIYSTYEKHDLFSDLPKNEFKKTIEKCYPLHPVSMFILPRLSERIAQNERTLFTFLSADGTSTLPTYLKNYDDKTFELVTPDLIYDYFEPLLKKEVYSGSVHQTYILSKIILEKIGNEDSLESKIIKTISLIYILEQFEKLKPLKEEIIQIYSFSHSKDEITNALDNLIEKQFVLYLRQSNSYLKLKESSGIDIGLAIQEEIKKQKSSLVVKDVLNINNYDSFLYPYRFNDEKEMTRYFEFKFIDENEVSENTNWNIKSENIKADGVIYGIISTSKESINSTKKNLIQTSKGVEHIVFVLLKDFWEIENIVRECSAITTLIEKSISDTILLDEYQTVYEDVLEILSNYINAYIRPENNKAIYITNGEIKQIKRKAELSEILSKICNDLYSNCPIINNEAINKNEITSITKKNRDKIVASLLRTELEKDLGLTGFGPDVSIMRNTLIRPGIFENTENPKINLKPKDDKSNLFPLLNEIEDFIQTAKQNGELSFSELYKNLTGKNKKIGARKGLIPIYLACVFSKYKKQILIQYKENNLSLNVQTISDLNENPEKYSLKYLEWDKEKEEYIEELGKIFSSSITRTENESISYDAVAFAMERWYLSLAKYAREIKTSVEKKYFDFLKQLKQNYGSQKLLFEKIPQVFESQKCNKELAKKVFEAKKYFDKALSELIRTLSDFMKEMFLEKSKIELKEQISLTSTIKDWTEKLPTSVFEEIFSNGTNKFLELCKSITNDENLFIQKLAATSTGLRIEDWNEKTIEQFKNRIAEYKSTTENFETKSDTPENKNESSATSSNYELRFVQEDGKQVTKRFDKVEQTVRGKLLYNKITSELDAMGLAISEAEKRQVLMNILKELC
ncbi:MAG: restriction endonuclease subunit S [Treponema bryantii]|nr:restriction endonuclease subunit S [Treponema bryantii]